MVIMNVTVRFKCVEGFAVISRDGDRLMNYIDDNGIILSPNLWFEWATPFTKDGYGIVQRVFDHTWNFIDRQGKILSPNMWFKGVGTFVNNVAYVYQNLDSWNYINKKGEILSPNLWFKWADDFCFGYGTVLRHDFKYNFIDTQGKFLSPNIWFDSVGYKHELPTGVLDDKVYYFSKNKNPHRYLLL